MLLLDSGHWPLATFSGGRHRSSAPWHGRGHCRGRGGDTIRLGRIDARLNGLAGLSVDMLLRRVANTKAVAFYTAH